MIKKLCFLFLICQMASCTTAEIQSALGTILEAGGTAGLSSEQVGQGLKQALDIGIKKGADRLSAKDGYYKSSYKILLPPEARKVTERLQKVPGFTKVEEVILEKINRGAEDAAKKAKPIFISAIQQMTFKDAMNILMGEKNAATNYLNNATHSKLYKEFNPIIIKSLDKFKARKYWSDAVNAYNKIPFTASVNSNLDDYVTNQALDGLFGMVEKEETRIRTNTAARTTDLLKKVFAKQD